MQKDENNAYNAKTSAKSKIVQTFIDVPYFLSMTCEEIVLHMLKGNHYNNLGKKQEKE